MVWNAKLENEEVSALRRITPSDYDIMIAKGLQLHKKKNYAKEIQWYNKIIKIQPNWPHVYYRKGLVFLKILKYSDAVYWFDKSLDVSSTRGCPIAVGTLYSKGRTLSHLGRYNDALFCYDKALEGLSMGNSMRRFNTGMIDSINFILIDKIRVLQKLVKKEVISKHE